MTLDTYIYGWTIYRFSQGGAHYFPGFMPLFEDLKFSFSKLLVPKIVSLFSNFRPRLQIMGSACVGDHAGAQGSSCIEICRAINL